VRVGQLAVMLGTALRLSETELQHLEIGGYLHDIGKIGVRDSVLLKPGALTPDERRMVEEHPRIGLDILATVDLAPEALQFVAGHHEKLDGSGYPGGIRADAIPPQTRMMTISDIYDALTAKDRPYKPAVLTVTALEILESEAASGKIDRDLLDLFIEAKVYSQGITN
jgi:diguanylate cyclase